MFQKGSERRNHDYFVDLKEVLSVKLDAIDRKLARLSRA